MNFAEAVAYHLAWKHGLRRILLGRERRRNPGRTEAVASEQCPLGIWIKAEAKQHLQEPLFDFIEEQHRLGHDLAIQMVLDKETVKAAIDEILQIGQFQICSRNLLEALEKLRRKHALSDFLLCVLPSGFHREDFAPDPDARG